MADINEVGQIIFVGLVLLFVLGITGYVFFLLIGGYSAPLFKHLLAGTPYEDNVDFAWNMFKIIFVLILISIFGYIIVKLFYEKEPTTAGYVEGY